MRARSDRLRATSTDMLLTGSERSLASTPFFMSVTSPIPDPSTLYTNDFIDPSVKMGPTS